MYKIGIILRISGKLLVIIIAIVLSGMYAGCIYVYHSSNNTLVDLSNGGSWAYGNGFGSAGPEGFEDVTDQYCLQKIK